MSYDYEFDPAAAEAAYERAEERGLIRIAEPRGVWSGHEIKAADMKQPAPAAARAAHGRLTVNDAYNEFTRSHTSYSRDQLLTYVANRCGLSIKAAEAALIS